MSRLGAKMIATVKCDRCGKEFNVPETENIMIMLKGEDNNMHVKDLCEVCRQSLDAWWTKNKA